MRRMLRAGSGAPNRCVTGHRATLTGVYGRPRMKHDKTKLTGKKGTNHERETVPKEARGHRGREVGRHCGRGDTDHRLGAEQWRVGHVPM